MPMPGGRSPAATASRPRESSGARRAPSVLAGAEGESSLGDLLVAAPDPHDEDPAAAPVGQEAVGRDDEAKDRGGWAERATVDAFVRYVDVTVSRLGDRVKHWMTHNEPWVVAFVGHEEGLGGRSPHLRPSQRRASTA